jgi:PKD repeat protein
MKKQVSKISLAALGLFTAFAGFAQNQHVKMCGTYEAMEQHFATDPAARQNYDAAQKTLNEQQVLAEKHNAAARPAAAFEYTVPVVFHILHTHLVGVISDADCIAALNEVNRNFSRNNADTPSIFTPFKSLYINSDIKFILAKKDPAGNCINGIVRHIDTKTTWSQASAQGSSYYPYTWDPTKYLNIYIVNEIVPQGTVTGNGVIVGYTYKPGTWPTGNNHDAIVYDKDFLGVSGSDPQARSLTHEIGHWLNLAHTFGNTNNPGVQCGSVVGGDGISDTPDTKGNFGACPAASTNTNYTCTSPAPGNPNLYFQNVENFMDYSSCAKNFTSGQTTAMRNALASSTNNRQNLWQPANLTFTGINNSGNCAPRAEWMTSTNSYTTCVGGSLTLKDFSYNGAITSYQWAGDDATFTTPTASNTNATFSVVGTSNVSLTVSNSFGSTTKVRQVYVIDNTPVINGPVFESFEVGGVPQDWAVYNEDGDALTWAQTPAAYYDGAYSYLMENATNPPNSVDILEMPKMDVFNNQSNIFAFAYAYRQKSTSASDMLRIQGSKDCGGTWNDIYTLNSNVMASGSGGVSADPFYPLESEWKVYTISSHPNWNAYKTSSSVMVRFSFVESTMGYGNNLYLDAINFFSPSGVNELSNSIRFNVYPNPANGLANVGFSLHDAGTVNVSVVDVLGKEIIPAEGKMFDAGDHIISLNAEKTLSPGIYFVNLSLNGAKMSTKLIIE